ncbi:hypothetical protein LMH73_023650 [Vibrio splendidus]|nr:hypothetical protein [Vibrio splendidus]MCC4882981.1 hypothetical protein [Vibrio splendidus]
MVTDFKNCENNVSKYGLLTWSVLSGLLAIHATVTSLVASDYAGAIVESSLQSNDAMVWGAISTIIDSGGFIKSLSLEFQIGYVIVAFLSLYLSTTLFNMLLKGIPLKRILSKKYWLKFYSGGIMYDEVVKQPTATKKKQTGTRNKSYQAK